MGYWRVAHDSAAAVRLWIGPGARRLTFVSAVSCVVGGAGGEGQLSVKVTTSPVVGEHQGYRFFRACWRGWQACPLPVESPVPSFATKLCNTVPRHRSSLRQATQGRRDSVPVSESPPIYYRSAGAGTKGRI